MERINIAELLKDCPRGMELDCTMWDNVVFDHIDTTSNYPIYIKKMGGELEYLTEDGHFNFDCDAKCVIYPKGKTTWEGFVPPYKFKDGDVLVHTQNGRFIMSIYKSNENEKLINTHVIFWDREEGLSVGMQICCYTDNVRFATKEEKAKLFDAIKSHGYKWDANTKTLEELIKPKFKVGDKIKHKDSGIYCTLREYSEGISAYRTNIGLSITCKDIEDWELVPNKFDVTTLKPFDKVMVRDIDTHNWIGAFYSHYNPNGKKFYIMGGSYYFQCIPYEENQHLLGTTNDCDNFYKTWE